jgi:hypothetical protein
MNNIIAQLRYIGGREQVAISTFMTLKKDDIALQPEIFQLTSHRIKCQQPVGADARS